MTSQAHFITLQQRAQLRPANELHVSAWGRPLRECCFYVFYVKERSFARSKKTMKEYHSQILEQVVVLSACSTRSFENVRIPISMSFINDTK